MEIEYGAEAKLSVGQYTINYFIVQLIHTY